MMYTECCLGVSESLNVNDFCSRYFSEGWDCNYRKCGSSYPVECKLYIKWSNKNRYFKDEDGKFVCKSRNVKSCTV